jgi:hypothetical protein
MELPVQLIAIISEEDVDTVQEMVRPQVKDIKDRKLVLVLLDQVSKVVRCHYTEDCQREVSNAETLRQSLELIFPLLRHLRTIPLFQ